MNGTRVFILLILLMSVLLSACATAQPVVVTPTEELGTEVAEPTQTLPEEQPIYLAIIWHQHQPVYFKDPETGIYSRPWVRVHAAKDYVDMAAILKLYPDIHVTFNLTPSLIRQIDDFVAGAKDLYWVLTEIPANELTEDQKQFVLERFFDTNRKVIRRFPRYQELLRKRDTSDNPLEEFTTQDYLDLQVLFNLAWTDPDWLAQEPLAGLVVKGKDFNEEDKQIVLAEHVRLIQQVIPIHRELQDAGQIEVTMTPFAHPILPLLVTTDLAREALPDVELPRERFVYGQDAAAQIALGVQLYEAHFGRPPRGMWPAEGSVAQEIVTLVAQNGIQWMASDEGVLANSLGMTSFTRDANGVVVQADTLYRPYYVQGKRGGPVAIVFRDIVLSDKVGFTYSGLKGSIAAADFIQRIHAIRQALLESGAKGPHLVSVILDGENAWEYYANDGKEFLHSLYQRLSEDPLIKTVTPSEFLENAPDQPKIDDLWAGSWIDHSFATWIGEEEENAAWDLLATTREFLQKYITGPRKGSVDDAVLEEALTWMYIAEGSDWFWWYGADQNSGNDEAFDQQFRETLKQVYLTLGEDPPSVLDVPIIPQPAVKADRPSTGLIQPEIDGIVDLGEWEAAGQYLASGETLTAQPLYLQALNYGFDGQHLYLGLVSDADYTFFPGDNFAEVYLKVPGGGDTNYFSRSGSLLGFSANRLVEIAYQDGALAGAAIYQAEGDEIWGQPTALEQVAGTPGQLELAIPLALLGQADSGDRLMVRVFFRQPAGAGEAAPPLEDTDRLPFAGPALIAVPDLGTTTVLVEINDPANDDHGPGNYVYPLDGVFNSGNFDVLNFQAGYDDENIVFKFTFRGPVDNPWGSPNGLALQTLDIYIDVDGDGQGGIALLPGRNLALQEGYAWDFAITAEGWTPGIYIPTEDGIQQIAIGNEFTILADPGQRKVTIRVPKSILGANPESWRFAAVVLSQEGFPSSGVMRVRDVLPKAEQWRLGGAPPGTTNHTRVVDLVWPVEGDQERWLSDYLPTDKPQSELTAQDFARVPMFGAGD